MSEREKLAQEYERGLEKMVASGHEEYAQAIINHRIVIAALRFPGEEVAWQLMDPEARHATSDAGCVTLNVGVADLWRKAGLEVRPLFADSTVSSKPRGAE
jgi:hypothetical protein